MCWRTLIGELRRLLEELRHQTVPVEVRVDDRLGAVVTQDVGSDATADAGIDVRSDLAPAYEEGAAASAKERGCSGFREKSDPLP